MFEPNMDEYLDEEIENVKQRFEVTCRSWEKTVCICPISSFMLRLADGAT